MLFLKNFLFTLLVPGTVAVWIPSRILAGSAGGEGRETRPLCWLGLVPILFGAVVYFWSLLGFARKGRGTPAPIDPPKSLVASGPYRFTRNPMYVAVLSVLAGEAALFGSLALLAYGGLVLAVFAAFVRFYEEPVLRKRFGEAYEAYCARVPRWIFRGRGRGSRAGIPAGPAPAGPAATPAATKGGAARAAPAARGDRSPTR